MNEDKVTFLIKAASSLSQTQNDQTKTLLRSYYLMRCRELSKNHGLPDKHFSSKVRCSRCFIEWKKGTETTVKPIKLSKGQKRRIKQLKANKNNKEEYVKTRQQMLNSNELKQICTFCKNSTITPIPKPVKPKVIPINEGAKITEEKLKEKIQPNTKTTNTNKPKNQLKKAEVDVYAKTKEIFSLSNKNNTLQGSVKEQKVIKNNKKKKDKFAGLCQQAVLMSAKLKQEKEKQNKLNLFLKPSS
ncbi:uncharacterized protein LOC114363756 [Ostrinia furnacalis]|uniref:uncharacterized protein LOC114363756 n=1 Tax=Ostrinia furnacalis TaxID=93504 RepID=UPI00103926C8|nr:uncharacterized protein LOC114363756 [Ostrinia furnacalis]